LLAKLIAALPEGLSLVGFLCISWPPVKLALDNKILTDLLGRDLGKTKLGKARGQQVIEKIRLGVQSFSAKDFRCMVWGLVLTVAGAAIKLIVVLAA
jgi:hypothetical protein